jgi:CRISPR/Cas system-associated protein Cas7 (RAMP superfamily)
MYKLRYYSTFKDICNNTLRLEIYKDLEETVTAEELILSADAVSIEYSSEDLFKPLKQSGCSVNVLTSTVLIDLYTGKLNDVTIKIYKNDSLFWFGYLTPNIYSSEFSSDYDLLTLEFVDCIAQLENIKYTYISSKGTIRSFYEVVTYILDKIDTAKTIDMIYLHNGLQINLSDDLLNKLMI